ncbi:hypothetical protein MPSEU_000922400 [Mayamaea pseudoterrestris]|nr:hypothetical protein MPSEU_000922400 [Mayamaea pseudoterrestris]
MLAKSHSVTKWQPTKRIMFLAARHLDNITMIKPASTTTMTKANTKQAAAVAAKETAPAVHSDSDDDSQDSLLENATAAKGSVSKATKTKESQQQKHHKNIESTIIYIGHLPRHFQEHELLVLLKQFGSVLHLRLSRSKKTGGSKGYAFVQFGESSVATIVANTLSGYLLDGKRLVCHVVAPDQVHKHMVHQFVKPKRVVQPKERSLEKVQAISQKLLERQAQRKEKLAAMGIEYEFDGYAAVSKSKPTTETKRKESVESAAAASSKVFPPSESATTSKKRKTSMDSSDKTTSKRKGSVDSAPSATDTASGSSKTGSERKRKDSIGSAATTSETLARKQQKHVKESVVIVDGSVVQADVKPSKAVKDPQSERKAGKKKEKRSSDRRKST